jgi:hypothetical protein
VRRLMSSSSAPTDGEATPRTRRAEPVAGQGGNRLRAATNAVALAFVELLVVPVMVGPAGAAVFAGLTAAWCLVCPRGPRRWLAKSRGDRDSLLPIETIWLYGFPVSVGAMVILAVAAALG